VFEKAQECRVFREQMLFESTVRVHLVAHFKQILVQSVRQNCDRLRFLEVNCLVKAQSSENRRVKATGLLPQNFASRDNAVSVGAQKLQVPEVRRAVGSTRLDIDRAELRVLVQVACR